MWWRSKQKETAREENAPSDRLANLIGNTLFKIQNVVATFLSKKSAALPANKLRWMVVTFCVGWFILSVYYISKSFTNEILGPTIYIFHLKHTPPANSRLKDYKSTAIAISEEEYKEIVQFQHYMDSLGKYNWQLYDSILSSRPGLMDSVLLLQRMYNQQKNEKHE